VRQPPRTSRVERVPASLLPVLAAQTCGEACRSYEEKSCRNSLNRRAIADSIKSGREGDEPLATQLIVRGVCVGATGLNGDRNYRRILVGDIVDATPGMSYASISWAPLLAKG
jgi:hypothetical protein